MSVTNEGIQSRIMKGEFKPNLYLTNMSMAYFQSNDMYVAKTMFPIVPVQLSSGMYYIFDKADLARDNVQRKPMNGRVAPAVFSNKTDSYACYVDQIITGIDQIARLNYERTNAPGSVDPRVAKTRYITEQMLIHQDIEFAKGFFKSGVWSNEWTGVDTTTTSGKQFIKFNNSNGDPITFFADLMTEMQRVGRRKPNRLGLGMDTFTSLRNHPAILERIKYGGSSANPALVNERVIAELLGIEKVVVFGSTYNAAGMGEEDMQFICDPKAALLAYATNAPAIDEPSAGYTFTWDMLGNGSYMPVAQWEGEPGTHTEFIEGLMSLTMKKTADDLGVFLKDCV